MRRFGFGSAVVSMMFALPLGCASEETDTTGLSGFTDEAGVTDSNSGTTGNASETGTSAEGGTNSMGSGDGDGDGDPSGDGDGDPSGDGDGDGDPSGDPSTSGDGDGDPSTSGDGDPSTSSGDGDGDGDGDGCVTDQDCLGDINGPVCEAGVCVECTPANDVCNTGFFCDTSNTCVFGCMDDTDCVTSTVGPICDVPNNTCIECSPSQDICPVGEICDASNTCIPGCDDDADCVNSTVGPFCETGSNSCVACTPANDICPPGQICGVNFTCVTGCLDASDCVGSPTGPLCEANECVECTPTDDICPFGEYCTAANECVFGCADDTDCVGVLGLPICSNNLCVECTSANDTCALGEYCDATDSCVPGCLDDSDCGGSTTCNTATNTCEGCFSDSDCALGTVCSDPVNGGQCIPGCNAQQACAGTDECCNGTCVDLNTDPDNCNGCGNVCDIPNADAACLNGSCELAACIGNFNDCNTDPADGCETTQACLCVPGEVQPCYTGPSITQNVGACADGTRVCNADGNAFSTCSGQTLPSPEVCGDGIDNDCNGAADEFDDPDQDGFPICDSGGIPVDCCEDFTCAADPAAVNPGAYDIPNNGIDEDCSGSDATSNSNCDAGIGTQPADLNDLARAVDLCNFTDPNTGFWGVTDVQLTLADGSGSPANDSWSVRPGFGSNIDPRFGDRLVVLSTGTAADRTDNNPGWSAFQDGTTMGTTSDYPQNYGNPTKAPGCKTNTPGPPDPAPAKDSVRLFLEFRAPSNAQSFTADIYFFSAEYPEYVCSAFNDFFVSVVEPANPLNPNDQNVAIYDDGNGVYPVGVNLVSVAAGLFTQCENGPIGQCSTADTYNDCTGTAELNGTGYDETGDTPFSCGFAGRHGGATGWLTMTGNVFPGEINSIDMVIWDEVDGLFDSTVLIDNWQWAATPAQPGVAPG